MFEEAAVVASKMVVSEEQGEHRACFSHQASEEPMHGRMADA
jgi:hypothetical protein